MYCVQHCGDVARDVCDCLFLGLCSMEEGLCMFFDNKRIKVLIHNFNCRSDDLERNFRL